MHKLTMFLILSFATLLPAQDPITTWNSYYGKAAAADLPHFQSRGFAILHLAIHDALNSVQPRFQSYRYEGRNPNVNAAAAMAGAAREVLLNILAPEQRADLDTVYNQALIGVADSERPAGLAAGVAAAKVILRERAGDFAKADGPIPATGRIDAYQTTPGFNVPGGALRGWGGVTTFTMATARQFFPAPPPDPWTARYTRDFAEIQDIGAADSHSRTKEQTDAVRYWAETGGPTGWNRIAQSALAARPLDLFQRARLFALLNAGLADAYISVTNAKYFYYRWRPVTAIQNGDLDGNARTIRNANWLPFLLTPPDPDYPSGHAAAGGIAAEVLARVFGNDFVTFETTSGEFPSTNGVTSAGVLRRYFSFSQAALENANSRVLAGIHFHSSTDAGLLLGQEIGRQASEVLLRPIE